MWIIKGELCMAGVLATECPGSTLNDKINFINAATKDDWQALQQKQSAFRLVLKAGAGCAVPPGFITLQSAASSV